MITLEARDWIAAAAIVSPFLLGGLVHAWRTAKKLGGFEVRFTDMQTDIDKLGTKVESLVQVDTAVQLLTQSMATMTAAFHDFRDESRSARRDSRAEIESLKKDLKDEIAEVRHDVRNLTSSQINPGRRAVAS